MRSSILQGTKETDNSSSNNDNRNNEGTNNAMDYIDTPDGT